MAEQINLLLEMGSRLHSRLSDKLPMSMELTLQ